MNKSYLLLLLFIPLISSCLENDRPTSFNNFSKQGDDTNNYLFDNQKTNKLAGPDKIKIFGEVVREHNIKLYELPVRTVVVKEVLPEKGERTFKGTFRYDGYSLEDILINIELEKKSGFNPITDLYVKVHSKDGSHVVVSWAEIFYPVKHHQQIIARAVSRHIPFKTPDVKYLLPENPRLIIASDLMTCRNISQPVAIEICSYSGNFPSADLDSLYWPTLTMKGFAEEKLVLGELPSSLTPRESDMIFYGRGRGIHGVNPFEGYYLSDLLALYIDTDSENIQKGLVIASAPDGYRSVFTLSEIMNRNDRLETLIMDENNYEGAGKFSLVVTGDFFSDRAMKALSELEFIKE